MTPQELFDLLMALPQPTRTEILDHIEAVTRNYEPERVKALLADFADMLPGWKIKAAISMAEALHELEVSEFERYKRELQEYEASQEEAARNRKYEKLLAISIPTKWTPKPTPVKEPKPFVPPAPWELDVDGVEIPTIYTYAVEVLQKKLDTTPDTCTEPTLPTVLDTPEAKAIFDRAKDLGLMDCNFRWLQGKQYLACFARRMSLYLKLGKGLNPDNTPRINWQPFEKLFNMPPGKLRSNYNDVKGKYGENPEVDRTLNKLMP